MPGAAARGPTMDPRVTELDGTGVLGSSCKAYGEVDAGLSSSLMHSSWRRRRTARMSRELDEDLELRDVTKSKALGVLSLAGPGCAGGSRRTDCDLPGAAGDLIEIDFDAFADEMMNEYETVLFFFLTIFETSIKKEKKKVACGKAGC